MAVISPNLATNNNCLNSFACKSVGDGSFAPTVKFATGTLIFIAFINWIRNLRSLMSKIEFF